MFYEVFRNRQQFIFSGGGVEVTLPLVGRFEVRLFLAMPCSSKFWDRGRGWASVRGVAVYGKVCPRSSPSVSNHTLIGSMEAQGPPWLVSIRTRDIWVTHIPHSLYCILSEYSEERSPGPPYSPLNCLQLLYIDRENNLSLDGQRRLLIP